MTRSNEPAGARLKAGRAILGCGFIAAMAMAMPAQAADTTFDRVLDAGSEPQNWLTHHGSLNAQRHSQLDQINRDNVSGLKVAWTRALGGIEGGGIWDHGGLEGTPIVEDGFMYVTDGWGSIYKFDVREGPGKLVWKMDPETDKDWAGAVNCCGVNNRGIALWNDKVISHTLDGRLISTDKETGKVDWQLQLADPAIAEGITGAPLVVENLAITGVTGAEYGIRGWLAATDLETGEEVWRTYTIPGPGEAGHETWMDDYDAWKTGGGSTWVTGSYDAETNLIYWGVGNPGPDWDVQYRPGDNLYTNSMIAVEPETGKIKFHFQYTPNDPYDYDGVNEHIIVDATVGGQERKALLHADRNGFAYAVDANDGTFIWGTPFVKELTWTQGLDKVTGMPLAYDPDSSVQTYLAGTAPSRENPVGTSCPGNMGGKNWPPTTYHPELNRYYIPVIESCNEMVNDEVIPGETYKPREFFTGGGPRQHQTITGSITAIDVNTGREVAKHETTFPQLGGLLSTAGDLVFFGHPSGEVVALDAETLEELWRFSTGAGINAPPMTYSVDGKQYIALLVGLGGAWPKWFVDGTPGLEEMEPGSMLYVFSL